MDLNVRRFFFIILCFFSLPVFVFSQSRLGAEKAAPYVAEFLENMPLESGQLYYFSDTDVDDIIKLAGTIHINIFELLDCTYRYITPRNIRIAISGDSLRKAEKNFDFGGKRILAIFPVDRIMSLQTGAQFSQDQSALDIIIPSKYETYIEIGTAIYETHFGFRIVSPLVFSDSYGVSVKKIFFTAPFDRLELYAPGKGAIYVQGLLKPKRWNLDVISKRSQ